MCFVGKHLVLRRKNRAFKPTSTILFNAKSSHTQSSFLFGTAFLRQAQTRKINPGNIS